MSTRNFVLDLAEVEQDDACGMRTWYGRFEGGRGIIKKANLLPSTLIAETHADLKTLSKMSDISPPALNRHVKAAFDGLLEADRQDVRKMELLTRRMAWFVAFGLYLEPELRKCFDDIFVDEEMLLEHDPLWIITRPDRLLQDKATKEIIYREYTLMPSGLLQRKWLQQWLYNVRLHAGMVALAEAILNPILPTHGQMMGLAEGYYSQLNGRLVHPYVWGYVDKDGCWSTGFKSEGEGWKQAPVWEFPGGLVSWVQMCGPTTAQHQFQFSPFTAPNRYLVDQWTSRVLNRERTIDNMTDVCHTNVHLRAIHFQKKTSQCYSPTGEPCQFLAACWDPELKVNVFKTAEYMPNVLIPMVPVAS